MKKLISLLLIAAMVFSLCACSDKEDAEVQSTQAPVETPAVEAPDYEALAADAAALYHEGRYGEAFAALSELKDCGVDYVPVLLALCHYYGYGTQLDPDTGVALLEGNDSLMAKYILADAAFSGNGAVQNPDKAKELYTEFVSGAEAAAELSASEYAALSVCYAKGFGAELDPDEAMYCADKAIEAGELSVFEKAALADYILEQAQNALDKLEAELNESGYSTADLDNESKTMYIKEPESFKARLAQIDEAKARANSLYAQAKDGILFLSEDGNLIALKLMGDYYLNALGNEAQDYAKAMDYYMQAADFDYAPAQAQIALMYQEGYGVEVSYEQAMEWNNRAAQQGNAQGQAQIGYLYHMGLGVTQNLDEAGRWYSKAADQGDNWAAAKLQQTEITNPQLAFEFHA